MQRIIAVAQRKGGVGKTTLAVSIAAELHRRGKTISLIDADPQRSACQWAEAGNLQFPIHEIPFADQPALNWARGLHRVAESYRCVVVDTAPSMRAMNASIGVANLVIIPCSPSGLDLEATAQVLEIINTVRRRRQGHPPLILVPNRVDARTLEGRQLVDELAGFGETVSPTIGDRTAFVRAFSAGCSVAEMPDGYMGHCEIQSLCNLIEKCLGSVQGLLKT